MAEKTKVNAPDDELSFNFDDFSFEEPKDDREPRTAFGQSAAAGLRDGFVNKLTDPSMYRELYRDVLPPGYDRGLTTLERLHSTVKSNSQYMQQQMAGPMKQAKTLVNQHVNKLDGKLPKGVVDTLKDWSKQNAGPSRMSAAELAEASLKNELNTIFGTQHAVQQRDKEEALVRDTIADKKSDARHVDNLTAMGQLSQSLERLVSYQDTITIGYQRKSLELQMRHYTAMLESINLSRQGTEVIVKNLQSIAINTKLPEFLKLRMSERAQEVMRTNFMNKAYDSVFGGTDFIGSLMTVLRKRGREAVDEVKYNFENALNGVEMLTGMAESMGVQDKNAAEKAAMAGDAVGDIAGSSIAEWLGKQAGKLAKKGIQKFDTEGKIAKGGRIINYILNNPSGSYDEGVKYLQSLKDENGASIMEKDDMLSKLLNYAKNFADDLRDEVNRGGNLSMNVGGSKQFAEIGQLSYGAVRSLEEIIPGYLMRIQHNTAIMATGDPSIQPVTYDFSRGQFVQESKKVSGISETLFDSYSKSSLTSQGENILSALDPNKRLKANTRRKVLDILLGDNVSNLTSRDRKDLGSFDRLTNAETWARSGVGPREAQYIARVFSGGLGEAYSESHVKASDSINKFGANLAEKREAVQALINTGDVALLRRIGLLDANNNYDPAKYIELLGKDTIDFGVDDTILGASSQKNKRTFRVGFRDTDTPTPPTGTPPTIRPGGGGNIDIKNAGVDAITSAIYTSGDSTVAKLQEIIEQNKRALEIAAQQVNIVQYQFGLESATRWAIDMAGKGIGLAGKGLGFLGRGAARATTLAADVADWGRSKIDSLKDIYVAGINSPKMQAWKLQAGLYRDQVTNKVIRSYADIKNAVIDENGGVVLDLHEIQNAFVLTPLGKKTIESLGAGKAWLTEFAAKHPFLSAPMRFSRSMWGLATGAKDRVLDTVAGQFDVFVKGEEVPRMSAYKLRMGMYRLAQTGTPIYKLKEITEDIVDEDNKIVLTLEELPKAYYNSPWGMRLVSDIIGVVKRVGGFASNKAGFVKTAWSHLVDIVDEPVDIYVKDDLERPRMLAITMRAGGYWCMVRDQAITRPSQIVGPVKRLSDLKIVLTEEDLLKGIVNDKGEPIKTVKAKLLGFAGKAVATLRNKAKQGFHWAKDKISNGFKRLAGFFSDTKGVDLTGFYDWLTSNPIVDQLKMIYDLLDDRLGGGGNGTGRRKRRKSGTVTDRDGNERKIGDLDGDGDVDGSNEDRKQNGLLDSLKNKGAEGLDKVKNTFAERKDKAASALEKLKEERRKKKEENKEEGGGGILATIKNYASELAGAAMAYVGAKVLGGMAAGAGAAGAATAGTGAAGAAGVATAGTAGAGAVAAGAGGAAAAGTAAAAGAGAATAAGAGAVATGAAKRGVVRTALTYGLKGAWWLTKQVLFKPTGLLLRGALMALPYALAAVGAILSSPVTVPLLIGSAVVGAVGYGIYAYANRLKIGNTLKMRMAQYGFSGRNDEHIKAVAEFEGLLVKQVTYAEDTAVLDKTDSTDEEFMTKVTKLFGLDVNNQKHMAKFSKWYKVRFKPVYLAHLTAMRKLKVTTPLRDVEDLVPSIKIAYVQATRALSVNYDEIQSPFTDHEFLEATATDVSSFAEAAIAEAKKKEPSAVIPAATAKTIADVATTKPVNGVQQPGKTDKVTEANTAKALGYGGMVPAAVTLPGGGGALTISPSVRVAAERENAKIGAIDAVRFRTYGLVNLEDDKMNALRQAEEVAAKHIKAGNDRKLIFNSDLITLASDMAFAFGVNTSDAVAFTTFVSWIKNRFLPTYLNYVNALNTITGRYVEAVKALLTPQDTYKTALAIRDSKSMDNQSVWTYTDSPWPKYTLNTDPSSVLGNIEFLKETAEKLKPAIKEEKISKVAETAKKKEEKAKVNDVTPTAPVKPTASASMGWNNVVDKYNSAYATISYRTGRAVDAVTGIFENNPTGPNTTSMGIKINDPGSGKYDPNASLSSLIRTGESGRRGYNAYNRGSDRNSPSNREPINLTSMTLEEIMTAQARRKNDPQRLFAVGKYQMVPETLSEGVKKLGISTSERFTPELQERFFTEFLAGKKRPAIGNYITGKSENIDAAINSAAYEWAALQLTSGRGYYDKVGTNHASISPDRVKAVLVKARTRYQELIKAGVSPAKAYGMAIGAYADTSAAASTPSATGASTGAATTPTSTPAATDKPGEFNKNQTTAGGGVPSVSPTNPTSASAPSPNTPADGSKTPGDQVLSKSGTNVPVDKNSGSTGTTATLKSSTPAAATVPPIQSFAQPTTDSGFQKVEYNPSGVTMSANEQLMKAAFGFNNMSSKERAINQTARADVELNKPSASVLGSILTESQKQTAIMQEQSGMLAAMATAITTIAGAANKPQAGGTRPSVDFKTRTSASQLPVDMSTSGLI